MRKIKIQLFADAGSVVNTSAGTVNAYTGAGESGGSLSAELKSFYDTELLSNAKVDMFYSQLGKKQPLPKNHGGTVEWRKWNTFEKAGKLMEGVIPSGQKFGVTSITGSVNQYGTYTSITDKLEMQAFDDVILGATEEMGSSAAETQETLIRNALLCGSNVLYCDNINKTTGAFVSTPTAQSGMRGADTAFSALTPDMVNRAFTKLKKDRVPTINGKYYAVIHPSVSYDLRSHKEWIEAHKYSAPEELFNGEIGELHGVRFIENVFAPVLVGADLCAAARYLTSTSAITAVSSEIGSAVSGGAGFVGKYKVTVSDTIDKKLLGRAVCPTAAAAEGTAPRGTLFVVGVDTENKTLYFDSTVSGTASGDFFVPGEGAQEYKGGSQNAAYATFFFGKDAFGIIDPEGGALEMIVHDKSEIGGPLNQFSTIGYKFETNGATLLYPERVLRVMSCSAYSATDSAN